MSVSASTKSISSTKESAEPRRVLFLFAHQDDEFAAAPWISRELRDGSAIKCFYLTNGGKHSSPRIRDAESLSALSAIGLAAECVEFLGGDDGRIDDLDLTLRIADALEMVERRIDALPFVPERIYAPSYEGGHPDHDAAHLIAAVIATQAGILLDAWHFSLYNAYACPRPLFRTLRQLPSSLPFRLANLALRDRVTMTLLCARYRSQWRTWIGLLPEAVLQRVIFGRERVVRFDIKRLALRPHTGELLYERRFGVTYADFCERSRTVLVRLGLNENP